MMKSLKILITALLIGILSSEARGEARSVQPSVPSSNLDFSGVGKFLAVADWLVLDQEPPDELWNELFATPGYAVLVEREFKRDFFMENFRLALMPSLKAELEAKMKGQRGYGAQFLPHYIRAGEHLSDISEAVNTLKKELLVEEALKLAGDYLPESGAAEELPIAFVIFKADYRGYSPIVMDILYAMDKEDRLVWDLAHEIHHFIRARYFDYRQDLDILWVLDQIHLEGTADLINVGQWFGDPRQRTRYEAEKDSRDYLDWYRRSPEVLAELDRLLSAMWEDPGKKAELGGQLRRALPRSGHPTAFSKARTFHPSGSIILESGKPEAPPKLFFEGHRSLKNPRKGRFQPQPQGEEYVRLSRHLHRKGTGKPAMTRN